MINPEELTLKSYANREGETSLNFWKNELIKYSSGGEGLEPKLGCEDEFEDALNSVQEMTTVKESGFENDSFYITKHRWHIHFALKSGRFVKSEVLADYPDLQMLAAKLSLQASRQYQKDWIEYGVDRVFYSEVSPIDSSSLTNF